MDTPLSPGDAAKFAASRQAAGLVEDGMKVGLGTGSTAAWMVRCLAKRVAEEGLDIVGVPTSARTAELASALGIRIVTLEEAGRLDLTIDGADEADPNLDLLKGGGGALLREKIVAAASARMAVIADDGKLVETLGAFPLPVEVVPFGWEATRGHVSGALFGAAGDERVALRMDGGAPFATDEGNRILDARLGAIPDPGATGAALNAIPGVVEHGLFTRMCAAMFVGRADGRVTEHGPGTGPRGETRVDLAEAGALPATPDG